MKYLISVAILITLSVGGVIIKNSSPSEPPSSVQLRLPSSERIPAQTKVCKYVATDLKKEIVGYGTTMNEARADASMKCFDIRTTAVEMRNVGNDEFMERGHINIDTCVNIRCS